MLNLTTINKNKCKDRKQKVALMPNLVHSLDAASLCIVIINYFNQENLCSTSDSCELQHN
jgi:DNA-directed RNA polymerase